MDDLIKYVPAASAVISAISLATTAYFAVRGLRAWRTQLTGKRRFEVAEQTLEAFEEAKSAVAYSRNGFSLGGEGQTRPQDENETPDQKGHRDSVYTPVERLNKADEKFADLRKAWVLFEIHFPDGPIDSIKAMFEIRDEVYMAVRNLLDAARVPGYERGAMSDDEREWNRRNEAVIYGGLVEDDPNTIKMREADAKLKAYCRYHLSPDQKTSWYRRLLLRLNPKKPP